VAPPGAAIPAAFRRALRDHAHTRLGVILSLLCPPDIRVPTSRSSAHPAAAPGATTWQSSWRNTATPDCPSDAVLVAPVAGVGEIDIGRLVWPKKRRHSSPPAAAGVRVL
jgi:hypothetical protein